MGLEALEFLERRQPRVGVVESDDKADRDLVVLHVIEEGAAIGGRVQRPARGVNHQAGLVLARVDLPQLLQADAVALRVLAGIEAEPFDQLLAQVAARAFGEDRVLRVQLHAELEVVGRLAVLADAEVAGGHALDRAVLVVQHLGGREAREDLHAQRLGLLAEPAHEVRQADDVVAFVMEALGQQRRRRAARAGLVQEQELVLGDRLVQRRAQFLPVRQQFVQRARVHDRARQDVGAGLRALFQHADIDFAAIVLRQLFQADGGRQAGGTAADDDDVVFHGFAGAELLHELLLVHCL